MSESNPEPTGIQPELPLPFPEFTGDLPLLPVRMVNEYEYCPRLAYLEWVQGEWADSGETVDGRYQHRRVDQKRGKLPPADEADEDEILHARSITLSSNRLGIIAKMDLNVGEGRRVTRKSRRTGKCLKFRFLRLTTATPEPPSA